MAQPAGASAANKALIDAIAGALGGFVSTAVMNPISVLVQGLQVEQVDSSGLGDEDSSEFRPESALEILRKIIQNQGMAGLFSGMLPAATKQLITSYLFYWWYSTMKAPVQRLSNRAGPMAAMLVNLLHGTLAGCATQLAVLPLEMVVTRIHASALEWPPQHEKNGILGPENQPEQGSLETTPGERTEAARSDASAAAHSPRISSPSSVSQSPSSASALDGLSSSSNSSSGKYRYESSRDRDTNQSSSGSNHKESTASAVASAIRAIYAEGGVGNFWTSLVPALLICVNPGLTQLLQLQLRNGRMPENLSLAESAWHGALSKLIAMAVTYPLSTVKTVMQSAPATQGHNWHPAGVGEGAARQANGSHEAARKVPGDEAVPATTVTLPATDDPASPPPQAPEMNQFAAFVACIASIVNTRGVAGLYRGIGPSLFKKGLGEAILSVVRDKTGWLLLFCLANFQMRQKQQKLRASSGVSSSASS